MSKSTGTKRSKGEIVALLREWNTKLEYHLEKEDEIYNAVRNIYEILENLEDELKQLEK